MASASTLYALDVWDGHVHWCSAGRKAALPQIPPLVRCEGDLVVLARDAFDGKGVVTCHDAATGATRWNRTIETPRHMALADGRVFIRGAHIQALEVRTGHELWSVLMGGCSPIEVSGGCVYTVEGIDRKGIYALRADTGKPVWEERMLSSCSGFSVVGHMGYLSTQDGMLRAVVIRQQRGS